MLYYVFYDTGTHIADTEIEASSAQDALDQARKIVRNEGDGIEFVIHEATPEWNAYLEDGTELYFTPIPASSDIAHIWVRNGENDEDKLEWHATSAELQAALDRKRRRHAELVADEA